MKQTTNQYLNNLMQTMDALVDKRINDAGFDRTIKCTVQSCEDEATGKYKVKFQDQCFYAFATDTSKKIKKNTLVYVLIPNNNMQNIKQIIGTEEQLGENYNEILSPRQQYRVISPNLFNIKELSINLDKTENNSIGNHSNVALSNDGISRDVNTQSVEDIQILFANENNRPNYLKVSGTFVTNNFSESAQEQNSANYGIAIEITKGGQTTYYIDELHFFSGNFSGNPFNFILPSQQEIYIPIPEKIQEALTDSDSDITVKLFKENFLQNNQSDISGEIVCSNFNIQLIQKLDSVSLTNYLFLDTVNDNLILHNDSDNIRIKATLSVNNAVASNNVKYYWGIENVGINRYVEYAQQININGTGYQKFLGYGWSCLNDSIYVQDNELTVDTRLVQTSNVRFKCIAVYEGELYSNTIEILNNVPNYLIVFTCSNQNGTLIREGKILTSNDVEGSLPTGWSYDTVCTGFRALGSSTSLTINSYLLQKNAVSGKYQFTDQTYTQNWGYFEQGDDTYHQIHQYTQWININSVQTVRQYKVTYAQSTNVCGTGAFDIRFQNQINAVPYLHMINGSQTFLYSETGHSPADDEYFTNPQTIYDISFNLIDGDSVLSASDARITDIIWKIPKNNTMLDVNRIKARFSDNDSYFGNDANYYIISREIFPDQASLILSLPIYILDDYNFNNVNNQILLQVTYNDFIYTTETAFIFSHQGEAGTNGTEMVCKIYLFNGTAPIEDSSTPIINIYNLKSGAAGAPTVEYSWDNFTLDRFQVICKLFRNGESIADSSLSTFDDSYNIEWSIYKNLYKRTDSSAIEDISWLEAFDENKNEKIGTFFINYEDTSFSNFLIKSVTKKENNNLEVSLVDADQHPVNIIKCTLTEKETGKVFIATLPVIFILHSLPKSANSNKIELLNFDLRQIMYNNNGELPSYNFNNNIQIQVSNTIGFKNSNLTLLGSYYAENKWHAAKILTSSSDTVYSYESRIENSVQYRTYSIAPLRAVDKYNSLVKNTGLVLGIAGNDEISCIILPIHAYLNTYGLSALNGWDGNALSVDDKGQFLLAPQVGAGKKNSDNTFTGVVIGTTKNTSLSSSKKSEHTGLFTFSEGKQTIFLDAETGKAEFGTTQSGKIVIDPENDLVIQTGQYQDVGASLGGLKINFSNHPEIRFGNSNFIVDEYGHITARYANIIGEIHATSGTIGRSGTSNSENDIIIGTGVISNRKRLSSVNNNDGTTYNQIRNKDGFYLGIANFENRLPDQYVLTMGGWTVPSDHWVPWDITDILEVCKFIVLENGATYINGGIFTNTTLKGITTSEGIFKTSSLLTDTISNYSTTNINIISDGNVPSGDSNSINLGGSNLHLSIDNLYVNDKNAYNQDFRGTTTTTLRPNNISRSLIVKDGNDKNIELCFVHGIFIGWRG